MLLRGKDLVPEIQASQKLLVDKLLAQGFVPKLAIIRSNDHPAIDSYMKIKKRYGAEIGAEVEIFDIPMSAIENTVQKLNNDRNIHGIIIQLPLSDMSDVENILNMVSPEKDVDGLGLHAKFVPATPSAILNLLDGYNIDLKNKKIVLIGRGKLVGKPLYKMLLARGLSAEVVHSKTENPESIISSADVVITATGRHGVIKSRTIKPGTVLVDAGTAGESGKTVGDLTSDIVERDDIDVSPTPGGVGPLTVCALFKHVIEATQDVVSNK